MGNKSSNNFKRSPETLEQQVDFCAPNVKLSNDGSAWPQLDKCFETLKRSYADEQETREETFRQDLEFKGHTCISILQSYPSQTSWCMQETCTGKFR